MHISFSFKEVVMFILNSIKSHFSQQKNHAKFYRVHPTDVRLNQGGHSI